MVLLVGGALLGGIVGLVFAVYFQDSWRARIVRRRSVSTAASMARITPEQGGPAYVAETAPLPEIVRHRRDQVLRELRAQRRGVGGVVPTWNSGSLLALRGYRISRAGAREHARIDLDTSPVDYATFAATVLGLDVDRGDQAHSVTGQRDRGRVGRPMRPPFAAARRSWA